MYVKFLTLTSTIALRSHPLQNETQPTAVFIAFLDDLKYMSTACCEVIYLMIHYAKNVQKKKAQSVLKLASE